MMMMFNRCGKGKRVQLISLQKNVYNSYSSHSYIDNAYTSKHISIHKLHIGTMSKLWTWMVWMSYDIMYVPTDSVAVSINSCNWNYIM